MVEIDNNSYSYVTNCSQHTNVCICKYLFHIILPIYNNYYAIVTDLADKTND